MRDSIRTAILGSVCLLNSAVALASEPAPTATFGKWGVETQYITKDVAAGDDFYRHVNKGWLDTATIPPGLPEAGAFVSLMLETEQQVEAIVADAKAQRGAAGSPTQQIADLHASYMDVARRNSLGISMLSDSIADLMSVSNHRDFARRMGRAGYPGIINMMVEPDAKHPTRYMLSLGQGGLGLPQEYFLRKDEPYAGMRLAYADYIAGVFTRAGIDRGEARARAIMDFETKLAAIQWTPEQSRDALKSYHPMATRALAAYAPGIDWRAMLDEAGLGDVKEVNLSADTALRKSAALFARTPIETLRAYFVFSYLDARASLLSQDWADANFDFYQRKLSGIAEQRPLEKQALGILQQMVPEQVGKLYAEKYFPPESKAEINKLVKFLLAAFHERLQGSAWMDKPTKAAAIAKLDAFTTKIGYPDRWHDFSTIRISPDDLVGNAARIEAWQVSDAVSKLKEPVRKWEWSQTIMPQVINAYYNPAANEIVFPAAILQPPFFDPKADPAVNFGSIGMVIGHEVSHGFDDQGNRYDGQGVLRNWWTAKARTGFMQRAERLAAQYDQYKPLPDLHLNGHLTLGENIGDAGGMAIAWGAYQKLVADEYQGQAPLLDGFTGNERFFLGYAQLWRTLNTEGFLRNVTLTDPHSPGEFRVNGVLRNFAPWYETYGVKPGNAMYLPPEQRVSIW